MVCGTTSDAGKSTLVAGLCRVLARRGVSVAPFKAQNMALNSAITPSGHEIGRAQAAQAEAAGIEPDVAMNPILLKPTSDRASQVVVMGRPWDVLDAVSYHNAKATLWDTVLAQLDELRRRFDVVLCEGAGSPAEINLYDGDIVNLRLADGAGLPALLVGDIDRGGVFAALYGTVALLPPAWRARVQGFVINKFRGDPALLREGPEELERRTGIPTLGVVPWVPGAAIDAEDSLALRAFGTDQPTLESTGPERPLDVAVIQQPRLANFTDVDPLILEPGVHVRMVHGPFELGTPDLLVLLGSKATISDLEWLRATGLAARITALAQDATGPTTVLGVCAGYQMLGRTIADPQAVEWTGPQPVEGIALLPIETVFDPVKVTRRRVGTALGHPVHGYEIHHGRTEPVDPWLTLDDGPEGSAARDGRVLGTSLHGLFEADAFRSAFLTRVAGRAGKTWVPSGLSFAAARQARYDRLADVLESALDMSAIERLIAAGTRP
jgi:adenosylcobyric acid synthase